jgi:hypothetical protein
MLDAVPRPPESRPRRRLRVHLPARTVLLGGLLLILAVGCAVAFRVRPGAGSASGSAAVASPPGRAPVTAQSTTTVSGVRPFTATVGDTTGCQPLAAVAPQLLCPIPDGTVTYMQVTDLASRYRAAAGTDDRVAERGDAACARGHDDERAWSFPTPTQVAGRYRCRVALTHAEMWWTIRRCRRARARDTRRW